MIMKTFIKKLQVPFEMYMAYNTDVQEWDSDSHFYDYVRDECQLLTEQDSYLSELQDKFGKQFMDSMSDGWYCFRLSEYTNLKRVFIKIQNNYYTSNHYNSELFDLLLSYLNHKPYSYDTVCQLKNLLKNNKLDKQTHSQILKALVFDNQTKTNLDTGYSMIWLRYSF